MFKVKKDIKTDPDALMQEVKISRHSSPRFILDNEEIDLWDDPYNVFVGKSPIEYIREHVLSCERKGIDPFPDVVGKFREKDLIKNALMSGSQVLLKGKKGYGKTTISKSIAKLLPSRIIGIKDCKIHDDPIEPTCFSCKKKVLEDEVVELEWVPRIWVRIPGDPMLTTRQLIGGISIQRIREGYDLDHPEVFVPGRALKANRGVGYFDELGAVPSSLQTMLHELFEENQVTTSEGDIVPFKIDTLEIAATNPANYRGTTPIKEPLLDRMEEIEIGPPESLLEEIEIGIRNMYSVKVLGEDSKIPDWHLKILARVVRLARNNSYMFTKKIESEPSCRATIKLYDHLTSAAIRKGRNVPLLVDYGDSYDTVKLAMIGRIELTYGTKESKNEVVEELVQSAINETAKEMYNRIPSKAFNGFYENLRRVASSVNEHKCIVVNDDTISRLQKKPSVNKIFTHFVDDLNNDELNLSLLEMLLESISRCTNLFKRQIKNGESQYIFSDKE